ncbi:SDR family oxidoreductase [Mycobacterium sp. C31M]
MKVLLTGAAGHVGAEVAARLVRRGHDVTALVHSSPAVVGNNGRPVGGLRVLRGDVRAPDLGVDIDACDVIVHCAAVTDFGLPEQNYTGLNIGGTVNALALARRWDSDYVHVSTAYVCGEHSGVFAEDQLDIGQQFGNDYENSKFRAEQLVRSSGLRTTIVRPGIVSGEHRTGHSRDHKHIYQMLKLIVEGKLRTLPGDYGATLALAPIGYVADVITTAAEAGAVGMTYHAVGSRSVSLQVISDVLAEYPSFAIADFVPPSAFSVDDLDTIEAGYYRKVGSLYTSYLTRRPEFSSTNTMDRLGLNPPVTGAGYLRRILDSCLRVGFLGRAERSVAEVLAALRREGGTVGEPVRM